MIRTISTIRPGLAMLACLSLVFVPQLSFGALNAYLKLTGETQGPIEGDVTQAGREGSMEIYGWTHEIVSPRDATSGLPTGRRQHKPITVIKPLDKASPLLMQALVTNELLTDVELRLWRPSRTGQEEQYFTIKLVNATISSIRQEQFSNVFTDQFALPVVEHVSFTYQKIVWTYEDGGVTAEDDWEAPRE